MAVEQEGKQPVVIEICPGDFSVGNFSKSYCEYLGGEISKFIWMSRAGMAVFFTGILTIIFGPETIYFDRSTGPTLFQMIQLYPGPIATVGALLVGAANAMENQTVKEMLTPTEFLLSNWSVSFQGVDIALSEVSLSHVSDDVFFIEKAVPSDIPPEHVG